MKLEEKRSNFVDEEWRPSGWDGWWKRTTSGVLGNQGPIEIIQNAVSVVRMIPAAQTVVTQEHTGGSPQIVKRGLGVVEFDDKGGCREMSVRSVKLVRGVKETARGQGRKVTPGAGRKG